MSVSTARSGRGPSRGRLPSRAMFVREAASIAVLAAAHLGAFLIRFETDVPPAYWLIAIETLAEFVLLQYAALVLFRVHRRSWRFTSLTDVVAVGNAIALATLVIVALRALGRIAELASLEPIVRVPASVIWLGAWGAFFGQASLRAARRLWNEERRSRSLEPTERRALVVGTGRVADGVVRDARQPGTAPTLVGLIAEKRDLVGQLMNGLEVVGTIDRLAGAVRRLEVDVVIVALDDVDPATVRRIVEALTGVDVELRIRPHSVLDGDGDVRVRPLAVEDLLGRAPVDVDDAAVADLVAGAQVLVTGAGGSIGSELCRQLVTYGPDRIILYDRAETPLWAIEQELLALAPGVAVAAIVGDVADRGLLEQVITNKRPTLVLHAAALKHVPMLEQNVGAAVIANVVGTATVIDVCAAARVPRLVVVSTDKAVSPVSVMGASKRVGERYLTTVAEATGLPYVSVRFGNVLGSAGSVVPLFERQIASGGPVTVTHPDMTRYFMTIPEACRLILQAALLGRGGETFVLDMGRPVRILDLAHDLIRLKGLEPERDVAVEIVGIRPGERLHEELAIPGEVVGPSRHPSILVAVGATPPFGRDDIDALHALVLAARYDAAREALLEHANVAPVASPSAGPKAVDGRPDGVAGTVEG